MTVVLILSFALLMTVSGSGARSSGTFLTGKKTQAHAVNKVAMAPIYWNCEFLGELRGDSVFRTALELSFENPKKYDEIVIPWIAAGGPSAQIEDWPRLKNSEYLLPNDPPWPKLLALDNIQMHFSRSKVRPSFCVACEHSELALPTELWSYRTWEESY